MKNLLKLLSLYLSPFFVLAQNSRGFSVPPRNFRELVLLIVDLISLAIPVIIALALLAFFWGIAKFVLNVGGGKEQDDAKNIMFWGVIALFVMVSVWGFIQVLQATFIS